MEILNIVFTVVAVAFGIFATLCLFLGIIMVGYLIKEWISEMRGG